MAKRNASSRTFMKWLNSIPAQAEFEIDMVANSEDEVWVDIDTGIDDKQAWAIYGVVYDFEAVDPTVPLNIATSIDCVLTLQVHRNAKNEILLKQNDKQVLFHHTIQMYSETAECTGPVVRPFQVPHRAVTMQETLRVIFRTSADMAEISDPLYHLVGTVLYDVIAAPAGTSTKIGQLTDL